MIYSVVFNLVEVLYQISKLKVRYLELTLVLCRSTRFFSQAEMRTELLLLVVSHSELNNIFDLDLARRVHHILVVLQHRQITAVLIRFL